MFPFMPRKNQKINWFNTKRLISGTLLVLTNPDFKEFVFAVVSAQYWGKDGKKNRNQDYIDVLIKGVGEEHLNLLELCSKLDVSNLVVLEGKAYFESYYHFLKKMQETKPETLPFKSEIIDMKFLNNPPSYLKNNYFKITKKSLKELKNDEFLNVSDTTRNRIIQKLLDESQFKALEKILTREISVIQGPPGTGKRFYNKLKMINYFSI